MHEHLHRPTRRMQRRALLAAAMAGLSGLAGLQGRPAWAQAPAPTLPVVLTPTLPDAPTAEVAFEVAGEAQNRLVFATLRCTVPVQAMSLIEPAGQEMG